MANDDKRPVTWDELPDEEKKKLFESTPKHSDLTHLILPQQFAGRLLDKDPAFFSTANQYEFIYAMFGMVVGIICVIGGLALFLNGVAGSTSWTARALGLESQVSDAAPGAIFGILGFFIIWVTRYRVRVHK